MQNDTAYASTDYAATDLSSMFIFTICTFYLRVVEEDYYGKLDKIEEKISGSPRREVNYEGAVSRRNIK
jgi:hypothetical protein